MVAPTKTRRIVCLAVTANENPRTSGVRHYKPSALVPWADPYIAGLVRRLQSEVRFARAAAPAASASHRGADATWPTVAGVAVRRLASPAHADLEPPSPAVESDWDGWDQPRWSSDAE